MCSTSCRNAFSRFSLRGTAWYWKYPRTTAWSHFTVCAIESCKRRRNSCRMLFSFVAIRLPIVQVQNIVHFLACDPDIECIQRIMRTTLRPESVPKAQKVLFPDLVENWYHRVLDDFVFQRRDCPWPLPPISFRYPDSPRRFRRIRPPMNTSVELDQSILPSVSIFLPCQSIHPRRSVPFQSVIAASKQFDIDMV